MPTFLLTLDDAKAIKARLWAGEAADSIADSVEMSPSLISGISSGKRWKDAPWPNGQTGAMARERRTLIEKARRSALPEFNVIVKRLLAAEDAKAGSRKAAKKKN